MSFNSLSYLLFNLFWKQEQAALAESDVYHLRFYGENERTLFEYVLIKMKT